MTTSAKHKNKFDKQKGVTVGAPLTHHYRIKLSTGPCKGQTHKFYHDKAMPVKPLHFVAAAPANAATGGATAASSTGTGSQALAPMEVEIVDAAQWHGLDTLFDDSD